MEKDNKLTNGLGLQEDVEEGEMCTKLMEVQKQMMRLTTLVQDDLPLYETAENRHETWIEKATRRLSPSKKESSPKSNEAKDDETGASSASSVHASACVSICQNKEAKDDETGATSASSSTACYKQRDDPVFRARVFVVFLFFQGGFAAVAFCHVVVFLSHGCFFWADLLHMCIYILRFCVRFSTSDKLSKVSSRAAC